MICTLGSKLPANVIIKHKKHQENMVTNVTCYSVFGQLGSVAIPDTLHGKHGYKKYFMLRYLGNMDTRNISCLDTKYY